MCVSLWNTQIYLRRCSRPRSGRFIRLQRTMNEWPRHHLLRFTRKPLRRKTRWRRRRPCHPLLTLLLRRYQYSEESKDYSSEWTYESVLYYLQSLLIELTPSPTTVHHQSMLWCLMWIELGHLAQLKLAQRRIQMMHITLGPLLMDVVSRYHDLS